MGECCTCRQSLRPQRRINGCRFPLNFQQIIGWIVFIVTALINLIILIEIQFHELKVVSIIAFVILYVCHVTSHITAALIDPSEKELRKLKVNNVPEFDRSIHAHVIENGRCHLCNIYTSSKNTKHCSLCNKCVDHFDHHCKWLNNCVGQRNYAAFITCVTTALLISLLTTILCVTDILLFLVRPKQLSPAAQHYINCTGGTDASNLEKYCKNSITFLTFLIIFGLSALAITCALMHLCCFHVYISFLGVSTYEYILKENHTSRSRASNNSRHKCCKLNILSRYENNVKNKATRYETDKTETADDCSLENKASSSGSIKASNTVETEDNKNFTNLIATIFSKNIFRYDKNKVHPQSLGNNS